MRSYGLSRCLFGGMVGDLCGREVQLIWHFLCCFVHFVHSGQILCIFLPRGKNLKLSTTWRPLESIPHTVVRDPQNIMESNTSKRFDCLSPTKDTVSTPQTSRTQGDDVTFLTFSLPRPPLYSIKWYVPKQLRFLVTWAGSTSAWLRAVCCTGSLRAH